MRYVQIVLLPLLTLALASCASNPVLKGVSDLPQLPTGVFGIVIPFSLKSASPAGDQRCVLTVHQEDGPQSYDIPFNPGTDILFIELPAASYSFTKVTCPTKRYDMANQHWPHLQSFSQKISLADGMMFDLSQSGNMTIGQNDRTRSREDTLRLFEQLSAVNQRRVVSAYTGQSIPASGVGKSAPLPHGTVKTSARAGAKPSRPGWPDFQSCFNLEKDGNPLWLGVLEFEATYEGDKLTALTAGAAWNSFTDRFVQCAKTKIKEFDPGTPARVSYEFYL